MGREERIEGGKEGRREGWMDRRKEGGKESRAGIERREERRKEGMVDG